MSKTGRGNGSSKNKEEKDEEVVLQKKKPIVVDMDLDLRRYINNRVDSILPSILPKNKPAVVDLDLDLREYIVMRIDEELTRKKQEKERRDNEQIEREKVEAKARQIKAALNARKMMCDCCPNKNQCWLAGLVWNTVTETWVEGNGEDVQPMTAIRAWVHAKKMVGRIRRGYVPETIWYKCIACDEKTNNLIDIQFGRSQLHNHIRRFHRMTIPMYRDFCNSLEWTERVVTKRFQHILMNIHREDYDGQLVKTRRESIKARTGVHTARKV
jgi:hypothetical protein